ncbi:HEPN domain-containing protein [Sphingobium xenophagum]|uniref:HEPN domain-containing protein n=1 Tax=Sphingobium xenophagum TaxID=121428 RepID=A0ABU1X5U3_SPHXE|nr:HEPN domain-containing protein [Sphingobium xenophagum]MDR7156517.1 HEPN domain-containing protein [Sphingobium xenophagum]
MQSLRKEDLKALSAAKLADAQLLFRHDRWSNAYYLAGYAVELAIKACLAGQFYADAIPDKKLVLDLHTHDLPKLVSLAGLQTELKNRQDQDNEFAQNWGLTAEWKPDSRYETNDKSSADYLIQAVGNDAHGVLPWIQIFW